MADIELVIKIPENIYRQIQALARNGYFEPDICGNSMRRIANGTPLPEHHGRLIDADILRNNWYWSSKEKIEIDNAETIIPATKEGDAE